MFTQIKNKSIAKNKRAFTLIELLIAISILSILMLALYKAYDALNISNGIYKEKSQSIRSLELKKRTLYLDLSLSLKNSFSYLERDTKEDIVTFQSANSIHKRYNPYITYLVKDAKLYRIESLQKITRYPFDLDVVADIDLLAKVKKFKIFESKNKGVYLIDARFKDQNNILLKVKALNEL